MNFAATSLPFAFLVFCSAILFARAGKEKKIILTEDALLSMEDWCALPLEVLILKCNSFNLSLRDSRSVLAMRLFHHFHPNPILNDNDLINFTALETLLIPENTTTTFITTSALLKKPKRSTSSSTITKPQVDQHLDNQVIDQPFIIETLREELKTMVQTTLHNPGYHATTTTTTSTILTTNIIATSVATWYSADLPNETNMGHNDNNLQLLSESMLQKIKQGKFINFDLLVPQAYTPSASDDYVVQVSNNEDDLSSSSITLVPKSQSNRAKVMYFNTWLQAWCVFVRVYCRFHSHRVEEVLHYISDNYGPMWAPICISRVLFIW